MKAIGEEFTTIENETMPLTEMTFDITIKQLEKAILIERLMRAAGESATDMSVAEMHKQITTLAHEIDVEIKQAEAILAEAKLHALSETLKAEIVDLEQDMKAIEKEHIEFEGAVENLITSIERGEPVSSDKVIEIQYLEQALNHHIEAVTVGIVALTEHTIEKVHHDEQMGMYMIILFTALAVILGLLVSSSVIKGIVKPLHNVISSLKYVAQNGDLTHRIEVKSDDEVGDMTRALNKFFDALQELVHEIISSATQLAAAAEETSTVIHSTTQEIASQKSETVAVASAINEMSSAVKEVAESAQRASSAANESDVHSKSGRAVVQQTVSAIQTLAYEIEASSSVIQSVKSGSENIGTVLDVIKNIAEQTNLLALNAAIEAARAGEQGRGFAVVADEVRTLAQKTQISTQEIEALIETLQAGSDDAVNTMMKNKSSVEALVEHIEQTAHSLDAITGSVSGISEMNLLIASAAEEQNYVVQEINNNIHNIQGIAEQTDTSAGHISGASQEVAQLSAHLKGMVEQFKVA
jgi:methyl-accepting chemotaxis protein